VKAIILAGGYAKRLWPITHQRPKPLLTVAGKPIINYIIEKLEEIEEITHIIVSTNQAFANDFKNWLKTTDSDKKIELFIESSTKEQNKLGTIGALNLLFEEKMLDEDVMVIAGDNIFDFSLRDFLIFYKKIGYPVVALHNMKDKKKISGRYGVAIVDDTGKIKEFQEKPINPKSTLVSTACYIFPREILPLFSKYLEEGNNPDAPGYFLQWLYQLVDVYGFVFNEEWYDIGDHGSYLESNFKHMTNPQHIGKNVFLKDSEIKGNVFIGDNVRIVGSVVENSILFRGSVIENCNIKNTIIDEFAKVSNISLIDSTVGRHAKLNGGIIIE